MSLVANERLKYWAASLDRASTAAFTAGWATPLVASALDIGGVATNNKPVVIGVVAVGALALAACLNITGYRLLGGLRS